MGKKQRGPSKGRVTPILPAGQKEAAYRSSRVGEKVRRVRGHNLGTERCDARINRMQDLL